MSGPPPTVHILPSPPLHSIALLHMLTYRNIFFASEAQCPLRASFHTSGAFYAVRLIQYLVYRKLHGADLLALAAIDVVRMQSVTKTIPILSTTPSVCIMRRIMNPMSAMKMGALSHMLRNRCGIINFRLRGARNQQSFLAGRDFRKTSVLGRGQ
jgi:hypothetical protein